MWMCSLFLPVCEAVHKERAIFTPDADLDWWTTYLSLKFRQLFGKYRELKYYPEKLEVVPHLLSLSLYVCAFLFLFISLYILLFSLYLSIYLSISSSCSLSISIFIFLNLSLSLSLSLFLFFFSLSLCLCLYLPLHLACHAYYPRVVHPNLVCTVLLGQTYP